MDDRFFTKQIEFLEKVPAIRGSIGKGTEDDGRWWVKLDIDITHDFAWNTVQELGHILNYISLNERFPTPFTKSGLHHI